MKEEDPWIVCKRGTDPLRWQLGKVCTLCGTLETEDLEEEKERGGRFRFFPISRPSVGVELVPEQRCSYMQVQKNFTCMSYIL